MLWTPCFGATQLSPRRTLLGPTFRSFRRLASLYSGLGRASAACFGQIELIGWSHALTSAAALRIH